ncbi:MAG TPA: flagellar basal body P-ring formation chaperone FlgA [Ignavibacteriales bacterium]|nr:flagellar basal body P-ring formation chaperone FlgA [Ignavibacteriales bacterium]
MKTLCLLFSLVFSFQSAGGLKKEIEKYLMGKLTGYEKISFEISSKPMQEAGGTIKVDASKDLKITGSQAFIPVILTNKGNQTSRSFVSLKISLYRKLLVAKNQVKPGTDLRAEDFELKTVDEASLRGMPVSRVEALKGCRARLMIRQGEVLTEEKLQAIPLIKRGDRVAAVMIKGNVEISMDAEARQDGSPGEVIRIMTPEKKIFRARVIDQYSVNIIE